MNRTFKFKSLRSKAREVLRDPSELLPHGGQVRLSGPYPKDDATARAETEQIVSAIEQGMQTLTDGASRFAPDVEPVWATRRLWSTSTSRQGSTSLPGSCGANLGRMLPLLDGLDGSHT